MFRPIVQCLCTTLIILFTSSGLSAATLSATGNNFLEVEFTVPVQPAQHDAIQFSFSSGSRSGSITGIASLYDGVSLLGSVETTNFLGGRFTDPLNMSGGGFGITTNIDYSSIANGSITGLFTYLVTSSTPDGANYEFDLSNFVINTFGSGGTFGSGFAGVITSISVSSVEVAPVPLPAALPLLLSALGFFGFMGWRRKRVTAAV